MENVTEEVEKSVTDVMVEEETAMTTSLHTASHPTPTLVQCTIITTTIIPITIIQLTTTPTLLATLHMVHHTLMVDGRHHIPQVIQATQGRVMISNQVRSFLPRNSREDTQYCF